MDNNNQKLYPPVDNSFYPAQQGFQNSNNNMNQPPSYQQNQPPNYQQNQMPMQMMPVVSQQPTSIIMQSTVVGPDPTIATCPSCRATITTTVRHEAGNKTHLFALGLCLIGCWPCCLYPYCIDSCQNANHTCPNCNSFVGTYRS